MRLRTLVSICWFCTGAVLAGCPADASDDLNEIKGKIDDVLTTTTRTDTNVGNVQSQIGSLAERIDLVKDDTGMIDTRLMAVVSDLGTVDSHVLAIQTSIARLPGAVGPTEPPSCPGGRQPIGVGAGGFCIDTVFHAPATYNDAAHECAEAGGTICSFDEWAAFCGSPGGAVTGGQNWLREPLALGAGDAVYRIVLSTTCDPVSQPVAVVSPLQAFRCCS